MTETTKTDRANGDDSLVLDLGCGSGRDAYLLSSLVGKRRAFKLPLEDRCEDYGQVATYRGSLPGHPHVFELDDHPRFECNRPVPVCGNTADMLSGSRYAAHFHIDGDKHRHHGLFGRAPARVAAPAAPSCC